MKTANFKRYREQAAANRLKVMAWREQDKTMQYIADKLGITRQRVQQIIAKETKGK